MATVTVTVEAWQAMRAIAVGGDQWTQPPAADQPGHVIVDVDDGVARYLHQVAERTGTTVSAVILARVRAGLN